MRITASNFARQLALALGICLLSARPGLAVQGNILLIIADDVGLETTTLYPAPPRIPTSPPAVAVPRLTALAKQGVLFTNAWATPACSSTRATIFTGRYGFRTGVGTALPPEPDSAVPVLPIGEFGLPKAFAGSTYQLAHIGKWHLSHRIGDPAAYGWPYFAGPDPSRTGGGLSDYFSWPKAVNGVAGSSTAYNTTDLVDEAVRRIRAADVAERPYFMWLAFAAAHASFQKPPNQLHTRDALPVNGGKAYRRPYYEAMIEALDTEIGRLLGEVDLTTTTVIFLGDNGTPGGVIAAPYDADRAKLSVYEAGVRVPFLIAGAGVATPGRRVSGLVASVDLFPTILALAGIAPPPNVRIDGISLVPLLANTAVGGAVRTFAYTETFPARFDADYDRAIRSARYKLIERAAGGREFFDLGQDPLEQANLLSGTLTAEQETRLRYLDKRLDALLATR